MFRKVARRLAAARTAGVERGAAGTVWLVGIFVALMLLAGLVFDGGRAVAARGDAMSLAQQAARTAADEIAAVPAAGGQRIVSAVPARAAAQRVLDLAGPEVTASRIDVTPRGVTVTVTVSRPTALLAMIGKATLSGTATARSVPMTGR